MKKKNLIIGLIKEQTSRNYFNATEMMSRY